MYLLAGVFTDAADSAHEPHPDRGHFAVCVCHAGGGWSADVRQLWHDVSDYGGGVWGGVFIVAIAGAITTVPNQLNPLRVLGLQSDPPQADRSLPAPFAPLEQHRPHATNIPVPCQRQCQE